MNPANHDMAQQQSGANFFSITKRFTLSFNHSKAEPKILRCQIFYWNFVEDVQI